MAFQHFKLNKNTNLLTCYVKSVSYRMYNFKKKYRSILEKLYNIVVQI